jgi:chitodextrinase
MTRTFRSTLTTGLLAALLLLPGSSPDLSAQTRGRDRTPPTAPTNLTVVTATERSVTLAWGPSSDNSNTFSYLICCAGTTITLGQTVTIHTIENLKSGQTYTFRVYARDAAGNLSKASNTVTVTLPGAIAAPTRPVVQLVDVGPTHVTLTWSSTDDGSTIWYSISVNEEPIVTLNSRTATFVCAAVLVPTGCTPFDQETTYTFSVRARDVDGNLSPISEPLVVTTRPADPGDLAAPTAPADVTAENDGAFVNVRWTPSVDNLAPAALIRYDVYVNGELRAVVVGQAAAQFESDYGVVNDIAVIAIDTADNASTPGTTTIVH